MIVVACGTSFGWVAPTLEKLAGEDSEIPMTSSETSWMVAILEVGNLFSPIPAGILTDRLGRKPLMLITGPLYIVSWAIILRMRSFTSLCVARIMQGVAIGIAFTAVPIYLGEIASQHIRGTITSIFQIAFYFGFLFEYIIGPFVSLDTLIMVSMLLPLAFLGLFFWQPESPHFHLMRGREDEAERALMWFRGTSNPEDVKEELTVMKLAEKEKSGNNASWRDIIATPANRRALILSQVVGGAKILSGLPPIISYSTDLFKRTHFTLIPPYMMTILMGSVLFISGFFSTALTDIIGRRPLLLISSTGCTICLGLTSLYFYLLDETDLDMSHFTWISPVCIIFYNFFLAFGLDPVSMTYRSELFPVNTRALAASISTINFTIGAFATLKLFQVVSDSIGVYFIFLMFCTLCFVGTVWMYISAIETKNKSFAEIQKDLASMT